LGLLLWKKRGEKTKAFTGRKEKQRKNKGCVKHNYAPVRGLRLFRDFLKIIFFVFKSF